MVRKGRNNFKMLIEEIYKLYDIEGKPKDRDKFFASEVDECPLAIYYSFKKKPKIKLEPKVYLKFEDGNESHNRLAKMLFRLGIVRAIEVPIPENELFLGRADAIVSIGNELYVVEFKFVNKAGFEKLSKPNPSHIKQLQIYLHYFNINKGIILVENKDSQELKEFVIKRDINLIERILTYFKILKIQIMTNEIPDRPRDLPGWKCNYCAYGKICEENVAK